ncbi:MAG: hypothetical protein M3N21_04135 [Actinomycetota bacterium]|nr:hypothetical protein [Actinomycetota bacterium]
MRTATCLLSLGLAVSACTTTTTTRVPLPRITVPVPGVTLPPDALTPLVPSPTDVPPGMVPLLQATGPRTAHAIASFSTDPKSAGKALLAHHFKRAYAAQYADPSDGRVLSVVVSEFGSASDAKLDFTSDVKGSGGATVPAATIGDGSDVRTQLLPGKATTGQLVTVRFRFKAHTWLVAYGAFPSADPAIPEGLASSLVSRAS